MGDPSTDDTSVPTDPAVTEPPVADTAVTEPPVTEPAPDTVPAPLPTEADLAPLVGLPEAEAATVVEERGWVFLVVERDGESLPVTADYREDRVRATIQDGTVAVVTIG